MFWCTFISFYNIIGTNLLTYCPVPVYVCYCLYIAEKGEKSILPKNSRKFTEILICQKLPDARRGPGGEPPPGQAATWCGQGLPAPAGRLARWDLPWCPFSPLFIPRIPKTLREDCFSTFTTLFRRHRDPEIGISRSSCPGTLPEGGLISGGPSITMLASEMLRE